MKAEASQSQEVELAFRDADRRAKVWASAGFCVWVLGLVLQWPLRFELFTSIGGPFELIGYLMFLTALVVWLRARGLNPFWAYLLTVPGLHLLVPREIRDELDRS